MEFLLYSLMNIFVLAILGYGSGDNIYSICPIGFKWSHKETYGE